MPIIVNLSRRRCGKTSLMNKIIEAVLDSGGNIMIARPDGIETRPDFGGKNPVNKRIGTDKIKSESEKPAYHILDEYVEKT